MVSEELKARLSRSKKDESERDALSEREHQAVLKMLRADDPLKGWHRRHQELTEDGNGHPLSDTDAAL